ncbi:hypothetical protein ABZY19_31075 [Streptomyces sp. NPDC006475]|uniref:hypothetical protein n=1 Tax=Streptomyces sp. NPDC006475 TaxID=3155719 RepID=UPI0033B385FA
MRENLREALASQVLHLIWLIDNVDTFGAARVAEEANSLVGALASAGVDIPESQPAWRGRWTQAAYGLILALGLFTTGTELATNAVEGGTGLVKEIVQTVENVNGS